MANNIAVSVTADTAGLKAGMIAAKIEMQDFGKQARATYRDIKAGDNTPETAANFLRLSEAVAKAEATYALYGREIKKAQAANAAANDNAGQLRAGFQNLGFQLQDVSVQFASGQGAATIFAQQLPQVAGALTQIAQGAGSATGALGRIATFMSGPWGVAVGIAVAVLPPLIAKLFETGDAADTAKDKVYGLKQALADLRTKPMEALGKLNSVVLTYEGALRKAEAMPRYTGGGSDDYKKNTYQEKARQAAIDKVLYGTDPEKDPGLIAARNALRVATGTAKTNESLFNISASAGRLKATKIKDDSDGGSSSGGTRGGRRGNGDAEREAAEREAEAALRAEIAANRAANQQIESLAEDRFQTEAELSKIALRSKIDDIEAAQRAGDISGAQAIEAKAAVDAQIASRDNQLQAKLFSAKIDQLNADRRNYKIGTEEYANYTRQIELLQQQHLNRQLLNDANARERERQARRQAQAQEQAEQKRAEDQRRAVLERTYGPFAATLARMITLQRGFLGTLRDLWGNLVGIVEQAVARMITNWLVGLAAQDAAEEKSHFKKVFLLAKQAAASAWKAVVGIPIIGPILAPAAAAASFAGVMAFASAEDGWDVPGGGGSGIDGRGGRPAIIHPREMVLPAQIADSVRALPGGLAAAASVNASLGGAAAQVADVNTGAFDAPRIRGGARPGYRRAGGGGGAAPMNVTIHAIDARSFERFAKDNKDAFGKAVKKYARNGGR